ncbi:hypothetical protein AN958_05160 [Leucoagaricus sp. SymC.cos]|nr:hypothetical protein AN958_05160 [Leucoagaricus sp. SymC.cos]
MLDNPRDFVIYNSQIVNQQIGESSPGMKILFKASLPDAVHDSAAQEEASEFLPKTKHGEVLDELIPWSQQPNTPFSVLWLIGPKSNLAHLATRRVPESHIAASFFFPSAEGAQGGYQSARRLFPTIAYQLATHFPAYEAILEAKLRRNRTLVSKSLQIQFRELITQPFEELVEPEMFGRRRLIVVEGLEESKSPHSRCEIIQILTTQTRGLPFRWLVQY